MSNLIALAMPPGALFVSELQRAWEKGDAVLPIDLRLPDAGRRRILEAMRPAAIVDEHGDRVTIADAVPVEPGDALVMSTSGTTGEPKGVVLTHAAVAASARMTSTRLGVTKDDRWLACLPVAHIGGLSVVTRALLTGTRLTFLPAFDPNAVETAARDGGCTLVSIVTTAMQRIDTSLFRALVLGAGNLPAEIPANVFPTYGMTETGSGVVYRDKPLDGVEVRVNDEQIWLRSPTLLRCYRDSNDPKGNDPKAPDGWFATGDAGYFDHDGVLHVRGRIGDMINTGGEKVWPAEVESVLKSHPGVSEALVYGEPDSTWGQRVVADIEVDGESTPSTETLRSIAREQLPAYAVPKEIRVVEALPRTALGKLRRPTPHTPTPYGTSSTSAAPSRSLLQPPAL